MASTLKAVQHQVTENEMAKDKKFGLWIMDVNTTRQCSFVSSMFRLYRKE